MTREAQENASSMSRDGGRFVPDEAIAEAELATLPGETPAPLPDWWG